MTLKTFYSINIVKLIIALVIFTIALYIIGVGIIGENKLSFKADDWVAFSTYCNNILSPILAFVAAITAIRSLLESKENIVLNEKINNALNHISLIKDVVNNRWKTFAKVGNKTEWEEEPFKAIDVSNIEEAYRNSAHFAFDVIKLCKLFHVFTDTVQRYTSLHKKQTDIKKEDKSNEEWARFSISLIEEQSKKMRFCYQYCCWMINDPNKTSQLYEKDILAYITHYEGLVQTGIIDH